MAQLFDLPEHLQARVQNELKPGEQLAWVGQPKPTRQMWRGFGMWLFFIPWTAFSLYWIAAATGFQTPVFDDGWSYFALFGVPFLLVGLSGLSAPFWAHRKARSTVYAITNLRAITFEGASSVTVRSINAGEFGEIVRTERADGSGDVIMACTFIANSRSDARVSRGFFGIPDVKRVALLIEHLAASSRMV